MGSFVSKSSTNPLKSKMGGTPALGLSKLGQANPKELSISFTFPFSVKIKGSKLLLR